jgi:hypothetical protein
VTPLTAHIGAVPAEELLLPLTYGGGALLAALRARARALGKTKGRRH